MTAHAPTTRQLEVAAAVRLHGSPAAAATHLGISRQTVETTLARYHLDVCDARIDELEHEVERLQRLADVGRMTDNLARAAQAMEQGRPQVSHRRIADGGTHAKEQRRRGREVGMAASVERGITDRDRRSSARGGR